MTEVVHGALARPEPLLASVVTLGTFDGVHRGHQHLVRRAIEKAQTLGVPSVAYTFDPHPATLLAPHAAPRLLIPIAERVRLLGDLGVDLVIVERFDRAFADIRAEDWVARHLVGALAPQHIVVGFNFTYGKGRGGDAATLKAAGAQHGFGVDVMSAVELDGAVVSSTRIRGLLDEGNVREANALLGRSFSLSGTVIEGDRRGRTIGFPTANLSPEAGLLPASGVYATWAHLADGRSLPAVTNIGTRPTFDGQGRVAETHVLDFSEGLYGQPLRIDLVEHLRPEQKFDGIDALVTQIRVDVEAARERLDGARMRQA